MKFLTFLTLFFLSTAVFAGDSYISRDRENVLSDVPCPVETHEAVLSLGEDPTTYKKMTVTIEEKTYEGCWKKFEGQAFCLVVPELGHVDAPLSEFIETKGI